MLPLVLAVSAAITLSRGPDGVAVATGPYRWTVSTAVFDVIHSGHVGSEQRLFPGASTVDFLGGMSRFAPPTETTTGVDSVELRGWADREKHLWYVARYQFFAERPFCRLVLTLTDRHEPGDSGFAWYLSYLDKIMNKLGANRPVRTGGPWDTYWADRVIVNWRLWVGMPSGHPTEITQHNSYSASSPGEPWVEVASVSGSPFEWSAREPRLDAKRMQLIHDAGDGANHVVWHPSFEGRAKLTVLYSGFPDASEAYKMAKGLTYEVHDASGRTTPRIVGQELGPREIPLGTFALNPSSFVELKATGGGVAIAGALRVEPVDSRVGAFDVSLGRRHEGVLTDGAVTLALKDFWQHHPISLFREERAIGWQAIRSPEHLGGGMGLTLETLVSMDGPADAALLALREPPARRLPSWVHPADGSLAAGPTGQRYDALLRVFARRFPADVERSDSFGWRNWGDYQIGMSYSKDGVRFQDWANLQYDLPNGLLLAWLRTGDPELWRYAQASVRHLMDIDYVKFSPFAEKLNNLVHRKGETRLADAHVATEPVVDQCFAFRSLLLYHALTGEEWARDLAKENIDRLTYYGRTRRRFVLVGDRPASWMLRGAVAGARHFPADPGYRQVADGLVDELMAHFRANGRFPGAQPVWQGQMIEGLAQYQELTGRKDVADAIVAHVRHLVVDDLRARPDGRLEFLYCFRDGSGACDADQWSDEYNYAFLWLGAIAEAHKISQDPLFATWGARLFDYGEARIRDEAWTRHWTSALGFPYLYLDTFSSR